MKLTTLKQFWDRIATGSVHPALRTPCWLYYGTRDKDGYGIFKLNGKTWKAHRLAYTILVGKIPLGLVLNVLCDTNSCVNPLHHEAVTVQINNHRGNAWSGRNVRKTICKRGHDLMKKENLQEGPLKLGLRICKACSCERSRVHRKQQTERRKAA